MKKIALILVLALFVMIPSIGQTKDLGISIEDSEWEGFKDNILKAEPNRICGKWNINNDMCLELRYTDDEWVNELGYRYYERLYKRGIAAKEREEAAKNRINPKSFMKKKK